MTADPWETHAGWWQDGFTDGAAGELPLPRADVEDPRGAGQVLLGQREDLLLVAERR